VFVWLLLHVCIELALVLLIPSTQSTSPFDYVFGIPEHAFLILPAFNVVVLTQHVEFSGIETFHQLIDALLSSPCTSRFLSMSSSSQPLIGQFN